ncbi:phage tail assembly protein [Glaesserella parasuis]|uniref:Phage tail assembly protein n=1 Tax=Glaesserella parasuis TaxID=738 RepID=A0A6M8SX19_GLAPU|nr:phage tail assembly protein [Glaesserella parasuis]MDD2167081.1 phage tail assembly protein [Glaesserella parasuis]MDG6345118.1 phage tail assembly protein [Glaesserella parasuis]MDG6770573.1 phage tail assembly protein [Glaesserella parasuis]MDO9872457.1 phage tail assembly protein [Glaesserella parasuis]MDO9912395.1 phage tail assembly protein [Glaesserella parasuis]
MKKKTDLNVTTVKLKAGIVRAEQTITEIQVRKPNIQALKGLKLLDLVQSDVNSIITLLPRITQPMLHKADIERLDVADFTKLTEAVFNVMNLNEDDIESDEEGKSDSSLIA